VGPSALYDRGKCGGIAHSQIGQDFAVDYYTAFIQPMYELAVGDPIEPSCGVDTGYPETAEIALALASVAIGIGLGAVDGFLGGAE
jgi:hypothetical protein